MFIQFYIFHRSIIRYVFQSGENAVLEISKILMLARCMQSVKIAKLKMNVRILKFNFTDRWNSIDQQNYNQSQLSCYLGILFFIQFYFSFHHRFRFPDELNQKVGKSGSI